MGLLNQELSSLVDFIRPEGVKVYYGDVEQGAVIPSVFIPIRELDYGESTFGQGKKTNSLFIKVFDRDSVTAFQRAEWIADKILMNEKRIPLLDEDGNDLDMYFHIKNLGVKVVAVGTAQIYLTWDSYRTYPNDAEKADDISYSMGMKSTEMK